MAFGELALLHDSPRTATIKTVTKCILWSLKRSDFKQVIEKISIKNYNENIEFTDNVSIFKSLTFKQKITIASSLIPEV